MKLLRRRPFAVIGLLSFLSAHCLMPDPTTAHQIRENIPPYMCGDLLSTELLWQQTDDRIILQIFEQPNLGRKYVALAAATAAAILHLILQPKRRRLRKKKSFE